MRTTIALFLLVGSIAPTAAQTPPPDHWEPPDSTAYAHLSHRLTGHERVRVYWRGAPVVLSADAVHPEGVRAPAGTMAWSEVSRVQVRQSAFGRGLLIGSVAGVASGLLLGLAAQGACEGWFDQYCGLDAADVAGITLAGGLSGALAGGLLAAPFRRWGTVYEAHPAGGLRPQVAVSLRRGPGGARALGVVAAWRF